jgi:hypothetical protein
MFGSGGLGNLQIFAFVAAREGRCSIVARIGLFLFGVRGQPFGITILCGQTAIEQLGLFVEDGKTRFGRPAQVQAF